MRTSSERVTRTAGLGAGIARRASVVVLLSVATGSLLLAVPGLEGVARPIEHLNAAGVPCGRVADLRDVFSDPQVLAQEMLLEVEHPGHGSVRMTGFPVKLGATPCRLRLPAPELGAHTEEVMTQLLGLRPVEIAALRTEGVL